MKITQIIDEVLIVDDDSVNNRLTLKLLEKLGFAEEIIVKQNGKDAIEYLETKSNSDVTGPSLILLDIKMPIMDGFDFLKRFEKLSIKQKEKTVVAILTVSTDPEDIIKLRSMGRFYFIRKPLTIDKLVDVYHRYFRNFSG